MTGFEGDWRGYGEGRFFADIYVRFRLSGEELEGFAILYSPGEHEVAELRGRREDETTFIFDIVDYGSDGVAPVPPRNAVIRLSLDSPRDAHGTFVTDVGAAGIIRLRRLREKTYSRLMVPFDVYRLAYALKAVFRRHSRRAYFVFVILLATSSVAGIFREKISPVEAILLAGPLLFLFKQSVRDLMVGIGIRKVGVVEFGEQTPPKPNAQQLLTAIHKEFGEDSVRLTWMTEFFAPRTKALLKVLIEMGGPFVMKDFKTWASSIGVPETNLEATWNALTSSNALRVDDKTGEFTVSDLGRKFLEFEARLAGLRAA